MLRHTLEWLDRRASPVIAGALLVGLALPPLAAAVRPALPVAIIGLLASTLLRLDWGRVRLYLRRPVLTLVLLAWLTIIAPALLWAAVTLLDVPRGLADALVLHGSSPVLVSVPAFALIVGLDAELGLLAVVATTLLQPFVQPPVALWLLGVELDIGLGALMLRLVVFVGGAFAIAAVARLAAGRQRLARNGPLIGGTSVACLFVFGVGAMDGLTRTALAEPGRALLFAVGAFAGSVAMQALGAAAFLLAARYGAIDRRQVLTAGLATGNRNVANMIAVLAPAPDSDLSLFFACIQLPIFLMPSVLGPAYRWLLARTGS